MAPRTPTRWKERERWSATIAGFLLLLALGLLLQRYARLWDWVMDDSFITFRYARHLAHGAGLRWNPDGPPVQGFTSLGWVVATVLPHWLSIDVVRFAKILSLLATLANAAIAAALAGSLAPAPPHLRRLTGLAAATLFLAHPMTALHAASGMETAFTSLVFTALAAVACWETKSAWGVSVLSILVCLFRPDGVLLGGFTWLMRLWRANATQRPLPWAALIVTAAVLLAYALGQWAYFGVPLPLPFYVKTAAAWSGVRDVRHFYTAGLAWLSLPAFAGLLLFRRRLWHVLGAVLLHSLFYLYPEHVMGYGYRFLFPYFALLVAAAGLGLTAILRERTYAAAAISGIVLVALFGFHRSAAKMLDPQIVYARGLAQAHVRLGHDLKALAAELDTTRPLLVVSDAGAVPYYSDWRVLDSYGLNDPNIARHGHADLGYIFRDSPEIVTILSYDRDQARPRLAFEGEIASEAVRRGYDKIATYEFSTADAAPFGGYYIWVLARPDVAPRARAWLKGSGGASPSPFHS